MTAPPRRPGRKHFEALFKSYGLTDEEIRTMLDKSDATRREAQRLDRAGTDWDAMLRDDPGEWQRLRGDKYDKWSRHRYSPTELVEVNRQRAEVMRQFEIEQQEDERARAESDRVFARWRQPFTMEEWAAFLRAEPLAREWRDLRVQDAWNKWNALTYEEKVADPKLRIPPTTLEQCQRLTTSLGAIPATCAEWADQLVVPPPQSTQEQEKRQVDTQARKLAAEQRRLTKLGKSLTPAERAALIKALSGDQ